MVFIAVALTLKVTTVNFYKDIENCWFEGTLPNFNKINGKMLFIFFFFGAASYQSSLTLIKQRALTTYRQCYVR